MKLTFKENFLMGVASAATQIEGCDLDTNWMQFFRDGKVKDNSSPAKTTEHWKHWREDDELMVRLGMQITRIGIEWARLFPEEGRLDMSAVQHYKDEIEFFKQHNIKVLLTIHHFSNPMWFEKKGGWLKSENIAYLLELVKTVVQQFGSLVSEYITINEPNVYATNCYFFGEWYPCHKSAKETFTVMENMAAAHIQAYLLIHEMREKAGFTDTMVSFANNLRVFTPKSRFNPMHQFAARTSEYLFQAALSKAMLLGKFCYPLVNRLHIKKGVYADFHAINYYSRSCVSGFKDGVMEGVPKNDLGWEIYPQGIVQCAEKMYRLVKLPIWITENGTADNAEQFRSRYIFEHLSAVMQSPLPIERYYHWCFIDNWEWMEGEVPRFGLVHNDYATQTRTVKSSGEFFSKMIATRYVTEELYEAYVAGQHYRKSSEV